MKLGHFAQVKRVALTHHDPLRDDDAIDRLVASVRAKSQQNSSSLEVFAAFEGQIVEIAASPSKSCARCVGEFPAEIPIEPTPAKQSVLLGVADTTTSVALSEAVRAEGVCAKFFSNINEARTLIAKDRPSLEHDPPRINGMDMCRAIRRQANDDQQRLPVVMVAEQEDQDSGAAAGVTDWLIKPFTGAYARTKIRAWVLRSVRRGVPAIDEWRSASPRAMRILDAEADDGFDRIARLHPRPQKGTERRHSSERATSSDKSALLWMYGREIASSDTPAFRSKVGEIIARATKTPRPG